MHPPLEKSASLSALPGVYHGFFGRRGGVSDGDFASLNASLSVGDDRANVAENIHRAVMALKAGPRPIALVKQVHGTTVRIVDETASFEERPEGDAIVTARRGVALGILTADCAPILLADATAGVIGAAHAGWRSAVDGILARTVEAMTALGARAGNITAAIGPTISVSNYEVGEDFARDIQAHHPDAASFIIREGFARPHFDLPGLLATQAQTLGLASLDSAGGCTYAAPESYFSHRYATHHKSGTSRQISLITRN